MANSSPQIRFSVGILVIITLGLSSTIISLLLKTSTVRLFASVSLLLISFFGLQWFFCYGSILTRNPRALFNEANVLSTYQPRARSQGHLFQPDPPTPVPGPEESREDRDDERLKLCAAIEKSSFLSKAKSQFNKMRDEHYSQEFQKIQRANAEMDNLRGREKKDTSEVMHINFKAPPDPDEEPSEKY